VNEPVITCGRCAASAPLDQWKGLAGAELPANRFQCPACSWAFERRATRNKYGFPNINLVTVDSELPLAGRRLP
jgi:hypothetical protein